MPESDFIMLDSMQVKSTFVPVPQKTMKFKQLKLLQSWWIHFQGGTAMPCLKEPSSDLDNTIRAVHNANVLFRSKFKVSKYIFFHQIGKETKGWNVLKIRFFKLLSLQAVIKTKRFIDFFLPLNLSAIQQIHLWNRKCISFSKRKIFRLDFFHQCSEKVLMCCSKRKPLLIQKEKDF